MVTRKNVQPASREQAEAGLAFEAAPADAMADVSRGGGSATIATRTSPVIQASDPDRDGAGSRKKRGRKSAPGERQPAPGRSEPPAPGRATARVKTPKGEAARAPAPKQVAGKPDPGRSAAPGRDPTRRDAGEGRLAGEPGAPPSSPTAAPGRSEQGGPAMEEVLQGLERRLERRHQELRGELGSIRKSVQEPLAPPAGTSAPPVELSKSMEEDLDQVSRVFRRTLVEFLEHSRERLESPLARVGRALEVLHRRSPGEFPGIAGELEGCLLQLTGILEELGVERFDAEPAEVFDSMIHQNVGNGNRADLPDGRVLDVVAPGFRSATGRVLLPAQVIVNRR